MNEATWHGVFDPAELKDEYVAQAHQLSDATKAGDWDTVFTLLPDRLGWFSPNVWRPGGTALYTPLHQAAWHGAPLPVVERLVELGSWRTLRTAKGQRAVDIAAEKGHRHLLGILEPVVHRTADAETLGWLDLHLAALVDSRIRPQITTRLRNPSCEVLTEIDEGKLWYPVPGMYGGFSIQLRENHLYVTSWCRVVGGSGQAHVVTREGYTLVDEGFV
ncbi:MAG: hypothetical protein ACXWDI_03655 [Nocardioides sp.]